MFRVPRYKFRVSSFAFRKATRIYSVNSYFSASLARLGALAVAYPQLPRFLPRSQNSKLETSPALDRFNATLRFDEAFMPELKH